MLGAPLPEVLQKILEKIESGLQEQVPTYLHCWGGHGRTGTVIACHLIEKGHTPQQAVEALLAVRASLPKNHYPFEGHQERFVLSWPRHRPKPEVLS